jgi:alcohol dehydrogenase
MRAVVYHGYQQTPVLTEVRAPQAPHGGVVIEVAATGVCRSDWHAWMGHDPVTLPHVPGHEMTGRIAQLGTGVRRWRVGQRVVVPFACGCGVCSVCRAGSSHVCPQQTQPGFTHWGSFADHVVVHAADHNLIALPEGTGAAISDVAAASLGCRFATAYRAVALVGRVRAGEWLAVHGCGGVGLSAVMIGVALGARVVALDVDPNALASAAALGAERTIRISAGSGPGSTPSGEAGAQVIEHTGGGAHVSVDAVGATGTALASVAGLRIRGRHVQVGLLLADQAVLPLPMGPVIAKELQILGAHGLAAADYPGLMALVADGRVDPTRLVGRVIGLDEAGSALAALSVSAPAAGMTVIRVR